MPTTSRASYLIPLLSRLEALDPQRRLTIVETGTIRDADERYRTGDGHATLYIAEWLKKGNRNHRFISIDIDSSAVNNCKAHLESKGLLKYVQVRLADSRQELKKIRPIDFAYLDSRNESIHTYHEFTAVYGRLAKNSIICIDDSSMNLNPVGVNKGLRVLRWANEHKIPVKMMDRIMVLRLGKAREIHLPHVS